MLTKPKEVAVFSFNGGGTTVIDVGFFPLIMSCQ
jgi:hypothetical protein